MWMVVWEHMIRLVLPGSAWFTVIGPIFVFWMRQFVSDRIIICENACTSKEKYKYVKYNYWLMKKYPEKLLVLENNHKTLLYRIIIFAISVCMTITFFSYIHVIYSFCCKYLTLFYLYTCIPEWSLFMARLINSTQKSKFDIFRK